MMTPQVGRLTKVRKIALCSITAVFAVFLVIGTTWGKGGKVHTSSTEECTVCHCSSLTTMHTDGCSTCHASSGRRGKTGGLYDYLAGATFDCLSCHTPEVVGAYHMDMDEKHASTEAFCTQCHPTDLPQVHEGLDDPYCLACHKNPDRVPTLPDNANCTSCHEDYNPTLNQCIHGDDIESHDDCIRCHVKCEE